MTAKLPWSEATEHSLLGAVLLKPEIISWLEVDEGCFYDARNRSVWSAMTAIHSRGLALDTVVIEAELERTGVLKAVGGVSHLSRVAIACASSANAATYASTLEEYRVTRDTMQMLVEVQANSELFGEEMVDFLLAQIGKIKRSKSNELTSVEDTIGEMVGRIIEDADAQAKGIVGSSFVPSGISALDHAIGGIPLGTVTAIGGRPGSGKSSSLLNLAEHAAGLGKTAVIFTTEDPRDRWNERLLAKHSGVAVDRIYTRRLNALEMRKLGPAGDRIRAIKGLHIIHAHGWTANEIVRASMVLGADIVGVDYIQKVKAPDPRMKLHEAIEANSKTLGDFAGKSGAGVVILSQLSKEVEKEDRRPKISDFRYGDGLAQECKLAILIHDPKSSDKMLRELLIAKRNQGEKELVLKTDFDGAHCTFKDRCPMAALENGGDGNDF